MWDSDVFQICCRFFERLWLTINTYCMTCKTPREIQSNFIFQYEFIWFEAQNLDPPRLDSIIPLVTGGDAVGWMIFNVRLEWNKKDAFIQIFFGVLSGWQQKVGNTVVKEGMENERGRDPTCIRPMNWQIQILALVFCWIFAKRAYYEWTFGQYLEASLTSMIPYVIVRYSNNNTYM